MTEQRVGAEYEPPYETKRVFLRADRSDEVDILPPGSVEGGKPIDTVVIVERNLTYSGPRLRAESREDGTIRLLTAPGPRSPAQVWVKTDSEWREGYIAELEFNGEVPHHDICLRCNEPLKTAEHRRRAAIGACI